MAFVAGSEGLKSAFASCKLQTDIPPELNQRLEAQDAWFPSFWGLRPPLSACHSQAPAEEILGAELTCSRARLGQKLQATCLLAVKRSSFACKSLTDYFR